MQTERMSRSMRSRTRAYATSRTFPTSAGAGAGSSELCGFQSSGGDLGNISLERSAKQPDKGVGQNVMVVERRVSVGEG
eukprot:3936933-Rhodomonas_salina.2